MSKYSMQITKECAKLAKNPNTVFIGYNTCCGTRIYHTLDIVDERQCIETPVAENLMVGLAMGMSLEGYRPIVCFERTNFLWAAADAIRHHLCMLPKLSGGQFDFPVVIRAIEGYDQPLDPGIQHKDGDVKLFAKACKLDVLYCRTVADIKAAYTKARKTKKPLMIVEYKKFY